MSDVKNPEPDPSQDPAGADGADGAGSVGREAETRAPFGAGGSAPDAPRLGEELDPRLTPARPELAAAHLQGRVEADRFVEAETLQVTAGVAALRIKPADDAEMASQLLHGEVFDVYEEVDGWAWGQARLDDYVGYVDLAALSAPPLAPDMRVTALRSYVFSEPDLKSAPRFLISLNAKIVGEERAHGFIRAARGGWVYGEHLAPMDRVAPDWVAVAEMFAGTPYLWGGKESLGLDCSGLIQTALEAAGMAAPRDTDMQEAAIGAPIGPDASPQRGDLVFWRGHVGVMLDPTRLLHANAHHMAVAIEPVSDAVERIARTAGPVTSVRRLPAAT